jgi:hypothetical protein
MISELRVGPQVANDGAVITQRAARDSTTVVMDAHARYQEAVFRGNVFIAAQQASAVTPAGLSTAVSTTVSLYNPIASGKNLVIWDVGACIGAAIGSAVAGVIFLAAGVGPNIATPTTTTALTPVNALLNGATSNVGKPFSLGTYTTAPVIIRSLTGYSGGALASVDNDGWYPIDGAIIIPPGAWICVGATSAITLLSSITWEEIPI